MRGVFWIVDDELKAFLYEEGAQVGVAKSGKPVIYMNPHVGEEYVAQIVKAFGLTEEPVVRYDGSEHYKCYLDR